MLALLLLWDGWEKNDSWPELSLEDFSKTQDAFTCSVRNALSAHRREEGLRLFALRAPGEEEKHPLGLLSRYTLITPARRPRGPLPGCCPTPVRWYDAAQGGFLDPWRPAPGHGARPPGRAAAAAHPPGGDRGQRPV